MTIMITIGVHRKGHAMRPQQQQSSSNHSHQVFESTTTFSMLNAHHRVAFTPVDNDLLCYSFPQTSLIFSDNLMYMMCHSYV
mmetsp:Transcript_2793/g.3902  ORF Transcript_2793/g.3902 Transcript_2793/m.3902 type:complete len:82 (-) Transcript_2793:2-247(-)